MLVMLLFGGVAAKELAPTPSSTVSVNGFRAVSEKHSQRRSDAATKLPTTFPTAGQTLLIGDRLAVEQSSTAMAIVTYCTNAL
jgi:hypothetical protein